MTRLGFGRPLKNDRLLSDPEEIADQIMVILPRIGGGTLRFWGQWFGKPYDNCHQVVSCEVGGDLLQIHFNENETLSVWAPRNAGFEERPHPLEPGSWSPSGRTLKEQVFSIGDAERVRWATGAGEPPFYRVRPHRGRHCDV